MESKQKNWLRTLTLAALLATTTAFAGVNVLTYHNSNTRIGLNANETVLTPANVASGNFQKKFTVSVDGYVYAQPLVMTGVAVAGQGTHDVAFVATEHNSVYAFDANSGAQLWQVNLGPAAVTTIAGVFTNQNFGTRYNNGAFTDIVPEVGITGTPVIDPATGTLYVDAFTGEVGFNVTNYVHRIHALDISSGAERYYSPVVVAASVAGNGVDSVGGRIYFNAQQQLQRSALTLLNGILYVNYAGYADTDPYHGWVIGWRASDLTQLPSYTFNDTPNSTVATAGDNVGEGGIWMAGGGLAVDSNNNLYFETGNGSFDGPGGTEFGDSFVKLSTAGGLSVADSFTPYNQQFLQDVDKDLGSGGLIILPDQPGNAHVMIGAGKEGKIYVVNRDQLTTDNNHYNGSGSTDNVLQTDVTYLGGHGIFSTPAYFNGRIYLAAGGGNLQSISLVNGLLSGASTVDAARTFSWPGATPSISANGSANGIVWAVVRSSSSPALLVACDANTMTELYTSAAAGTRDQLAAGVKFAVPTIANGSVFVGGQGSLSVFGLANAATVATPVITPSGGAFNLSVGVSITDATAGAAIYYTLDGSAPTTASTLYAGTFVITDSAGVRARAFKSGALDSGIDGADFIITHIVSDTTPPSCDISAPASGQHVNGDQFTLTGTAADNVGVASVAYNVNGTGWNTPLTGDNWNTWFANVSLLLGTNTIQAYATDGSGNVSVIRTVTFVSEASAPLAVSINGSGSISPNYNNVSLPLGADYTMTATPAAGFRFVNWTDASGYVWTNSPTLRFRMDWGLNFTANFVDGVKPVVVVTNFFSGALVSNEWFTIKGRATDNVGVAGVLVNLNNAGPAWADNFDGRNWSSLLDLVPGTNTLVCSCWDAAGNYSDPVTVRLVYVLTAPLTISTNGRGTITPALNGAQLRVGQRYTLTARPATGYKFTGWTDAYGNYVANSPTFSFLMNFNLVFTANFVDSARPTVAVTTPSARTVTRSEFFTASGRAADNTAVAGVWYQLNGGFPQPVAGVNNWTTWSVVLDLVPGTNTFAVFATDTTGNVSTTNTIRFVYATAPRSVNGLKARVTPTGQSSFNLAFGANTFSQLADSTNGLTGVGSYTYVRLTPDTAQLKLNYTAPPQAKNAGAQTVSLLFAVPDIARFANNATAGDMVFVSTPAIAARSLVGQTLVQVSTLGQGRSDSFTRNAKFISTNLATRTASSGTGYGYLNVSPVGALLRQDSPAGTTWSVLNFQDAATGVTYSEHYDAAGNFTGTDTGMFGLTSQRFGGNAPTNLVNARAVVTSVDNRFKLMFADGQNFLQVDPHNDAVVHAAGTYSYAPTTANAGVLNLNYTAPVETSSALLQFFAPNVAVFTNADSTVGAAVFK